MTDRTTRRLANKTALITGSACGIGPSFAERYVEEGARVAIADINLEAAQNTATEIGDAAIALAIDVTNQASIDACVDAAAQVFGGNDILINCAVGDPRGRMAS